MTVFPHGNTPRTVVIPVGDPSPGACETVAETLRETFEMPVSIRQGIDEPDDGVTDSITDRPAHPSETHDGPDLNDLNV